MNILLHSVPLAVLMSVCGVQCVSGFTQTNMDVGDQRARVSPNVVRSYVATPSTALGAAECAPNVTIAPAHQPVVGEMLARSPTFRRQCARLAGATHVTVLIRSNPPAGSLTQALTHISMRPIGRIDALVHVGPSPLATELIAHELEHILEQLDGVDLAAKSRLRDSGVRRTGPLDAFETTRAIVTGRRVAREVLDRAP
jgi:hypothetical protein